MHTITIPGIYGSGPDHWQTLWEKNDSSLIRFHPSDWDRPRLGDWIDALERSVREAPESPVLLAHSLGCLLVAHWAAQTKREVRGAMLVSVPDPAGTNFPSEAASFADVPEVPLPFPTLIVSSSNDPYGTQEYARSRAKQWKSTFVAIGDFGHINESKKLAEWGYGRGAFDCFVASLRNRSILSKGLGQRVIVS